MGIGSSNNDRQNRCFGDSDLNASIPPSRYKRPKYKIVPLSVDVVTSVTFRLESDPTNGKPTIVWDQKHTIQGGSRCLDHSMINMIETISHKPKQENKYFPVSIKRTLENCSEMPIPLNYRWVLNYNNSIDSIESEFVINAYTPPNDYDTTVYSNPIDVDKISEYSPIRDDFCSYTPKQDEISCIVDTDTVFYDLIQWHIQEDRESVKRREGAIFQSAIENAYKVKVDIQKDSQFRVMDTQIYKSVRMSSESFRAVKDYFKKRIFNNLKELDIQNSGIYIDLDSYMTDTKLNTFIAAIQKKYYGKNVLESQKSITCNFQHRIEMYVLKPPSPVYSKHDDGMEMRFVNKNASTTTTKKHDTRYSMNISRETIGTSFNPNNPVNQTVFNHHHHDHHEEEHQSTNPIGDTRPKNNNLDNTTKSSKTIELPQDGLLSKEVLHQQDQSHHHHITMTLVQDNDTVEIPVIQEEKLLQLLDTNKQE